MGVWTPYSGAAVITSATGAWQDLDLSSIVGSNVAVVVLELTGPGPLMVRGKGSSEDTGPGLITGTKGNHAARCSTNRSAYLLTKTDISGVIQFIDPDGIGWTDDVFLVGFFVPSYGGTHLRDAAPGFGITAAWSTEYIYSQHRPPVGRTALCQHVLRTEEHSLAIAVRPEGETGNYWKPFSGVYYMGANGCRTDSPLPAIYYMYPLITETGSVGSYDIAGNGAGTIHQTYTYWSEWGSYLKARNTIFTAQTLPVRTTTWLAVDLSPYLGAQASLAVLRLSVNAGGTSGSYGAVRTYGSADTAHTVGSVYGSGNQQMGSQPGDGAVVICPTDANGRIEVAATQVGKVFDLELLGAVTQYSSVPPTVSAGTVSPSGTFVSLAAPASLRWRLNDPSGSGIDTATFDAVATDQTGRQIQLITAGSLASGITGYLAANTAGIGGDPTEIEAVLDWPAAMVSGHRYTMSVDATNNMGFSL